MTFARFYPVMPDIHWLERLVPLGIEVIQLRLKEASETEIKAQISHAIKLCAQHNVQLIVNDYWKEAIELGADYIHLGQEDLAAADLAFIKAKGLKLGVSTHSLEELSIALAAQPDYVALGPVYETLLKKMKWDPQGLEKVKQWRSKLNIPLIAIGGITPERAPKVLQAGANSVAVVTDLVTSDDVENRVAEWLRVTA